MVAFAVPELNKPVTIQVNELLHESVRLTLPAEEEIEVCFELDGALPLLQGSEPKLKMIFGNVISNAAKAMKHKGVLTITTHTEDNAGIKITFADTGPGVAPSIMDSIFDPFFTTRRNQGGTGLGLSVCRETLKECGGEIVASNRPDGGAVFTLTLPQTHHEEVLAHRAAAGVSSRT